MVDLTVTIRSLAAGVLLAGLWAGELRAEAQVYFLVRHAEKALEGTKDPELNGLGTARAETLADLLSAAGITRIFSSDFRRTRQTAAPLAERLGIVVESYDPRDLNGFAARLRDMQGRILIVGHSNTTPHLTDLLGGHGGAPIDENSEYDRLYMVLPGETGATTVLLTYGQGADQAERGTREVVR